MVDVAALLARWDAAMAAQDGAAAAAMSPEDVDAHARDGGGEAVIETITVVTLRDGLFAKIEMFPHEAAARAAMG